MTWNLDGKNLEEDLNWLIRNGAEYPDGNDKEQKTL